MDEAITEKVDEAIARLGEHFDSVRIFVTKHDGSKETTTEYSAGGGNLYAQLGQIREWISRQDQYARNYDDLEDD